jgi:hypothetical protein
MTLTISEQGVKHDSRLASFRHFLKAPLAVPAPRPRFHSHPFTRPCPRFSCHQRPAIPLPQWLCFHSTIPGDSDSKACGIALCVDIDLGSFGAFYGLALSRRRRHHPSVIAICHSPFAMCYLPSVLRHLPSVLCHQSFT